MLRTTFNHTKSLNSTKSHISFHSKASSKSNTVGKDKDRSYKLQENISMNIKPKTFVICGKVPMYLLEKRKDF